MTKPKTNEDNPFFREENGLDDEIEILEVVGLDEEAAPASAVDEVSPDPEAHPDEIVLDLDEPGPDASEFPPGNVDRSRHSKAAIDERERYLRLQADFENFKRRGERERDDFERHAAAKLLTRLLPVLDNFERAVSVRPTGAADASFMDGVVLIFRQLLDELRKDGLSAIDSVGQPFDPNVHEAVATDFSDEFPPNTVIEELQRGYRLGTKLLRPSLVKVALDPRERSGFHGNGEDS